MSKSEVTPRPSGEAGAVGQEVGVQCCLPIWFAAESEISRMADQRCQLGLIPRKQWLRLPPWSRRASQGTRFLPLSHLAPSPSPHTTGIRWTCDSGSNGKRGQRESVCYQISLLVASLIGETQAHIDRQDYCYFFISCSPVPSIVMWSLTWQTVKTLSLSFFACSTEKKGTRLAS